MRAQTIQDIMRRQFRGVCKWITGYAGTSPGVLEVRKITGGRSIRQGLATPERGPGALDVAREMRNQVGIEGPPGDEFLSIGCGGGAPVGQFFIDSSEPAKRPGNICLVGTGAAHHEPFGAG